MYISFSSTAHSLSKLFRETSAEANGAIAFSDAEVSGFRRRKHLAKPQPAPTNVKGHPTVAEKTPKTHFAAVTTLPPGVLPEGDRTDDDEGDYCRPNFLGM